MVFFFPCCHHKAPTTQSSFRGKTNPDFLSFAAVCSHKSMTNCWLCLFAAKKLMMMRLGCCYRMTQEKRSFSLWIFPVVNKLKENRAELNRVADNRLRSSLALLTRKLNERVGGGRVTKRLIHQIEVGCSKADNLVPEIELVQ